jgi:hypothetical protein
MPAKISSLASLAFLVVAVLMVLLCPLQRADERPASHTVTDTDVKPAQALERFTACTTSDGTSCLGTGGGLNPDVTLDVGTTISMEVQSSYFSCPTTVTADVTWGDGSAEQYMTGAAGDFIGPFTHTYNSAGTFGIVFGDSCDGDGEPMNIVISGSGGGFLAFGDIPSADLAAASIGAFLGFVTIIVVAQSTLPPRSAAARHQRFEYEKHRGKTGSKESHGHGHDHYYSTGPAAPPPPTSYSPNQVNPIVGGGQSIGGPGASVGSSAPTSASIASTPQSQWPYCPEHPGVQLSPRVFWQPGLIVESWQVPEWWCPMPPGTIGHWPFHLGVQSTFTPRTR